VDIKAEADATDAFYRAPYINRRPLGPFHPYTANAALNYGRAIATGNLLKVKACSARRPF
jgi:hypothetical protein